MKYSSEINEVSKALLSAQKLIGNAHKDAKNPFFKSKYADLTSVIDACKDALNSNGISVVQGVDGDENGTYVETILLHESGQYISSKIKLIIGKNDMQGLGSAITYARRYAIQSMAFVGAEDDDANKSSQQSQSNPKPSPGEIKDLLEMIKRSGVTPTQETERWASGLTSVQIQLQIKNIQSKL